jgi:ribosomal protein S12 methylthiotransferase
MIRENIAKLRREVPGIFLRSTAIVGFPGETEEQFEELCRFIKETKFERFGAFTYSREEGTPAYRMKAQIPAPVKKKRRKELMLAQQEIAFENAARMKGRILDALVEGKIAGEDVYAARTYRDAPGVDGLLFIETRKELMTGDFIQVKVTGSQEYDLIGRPV